MTANLLKCELKKWRNKMRIINEKFFDQLSINPGNTDLPYIDIFKDKVCGLDSSMMHLGNYIWFLNCSFKGYKIAKKLRPILSFDDFMRERWLEDISTKSNMEFSPGGEE